MSSWAKLDDAEFQAFAKRVGDAVKAQTLVKAVERSLELSGKYVLKEVKQRTPVDTGSLRGKWRLTTPTYTGSVFSYDVYNNVEYASFVENGHRVKSSAKGLKKLFTKKKWIEGAFMLKSTIDDHDKNLNKIIEPEVQKALNQIFGGD